MKEVSQFHKFERDVKEALRNYAAHGANGDGRPRRVEAESPRSGLELLAENDSDANPRIDTRNHLNLRGTPAAVTISSPPIPSSKQALGKSSVTFAIGRIAIAVTFIVSALFRLVDADANATMIASKLLLLPGPLANAVASIEATLGLPFATVLVIAGAMLESAAGVLIAMGTFIRTASIVLLIISAIGLYWFQSDFQNGVRSDQIIRALNQLSIMGALLILSSRAWEPQPQSSKESLWDPGPIRG